MFAVLGGKRLACLLYFWKKTSMFAIFGGERLACLLFFGEKTMFAIFGEKISMFDFFGWPKD